MKEWVASGTAVILLALAMLIWSVAPASECSTFQGINWWMGLLPFVLAVAADTYAIAFGSRPQRLTLFLISMAIVAGYVWTLSQSLPIAFATEISCAAEAKR